TLDSPGVDSFSYPSSGLFRLSQIKGVHKEPLVILRLLILLVSNSFDSPGGLFQLSWWWTLLIILVVDSFDSLCGGGSGFF
ncbi:12305_t:CDS:2, partial [Gigaspora rosea]